MAQTHTLPERQILLRHPWAQQVLPFLTSLALHAGVLVTGAMFFLGARLVRQATPAHVEETVIPSAWMNDDRAPVAELAAFGSNSDRRAMQDRIREVDTPDGWANKKGPKLPLDPGGGAGDSTDQVIALGPGGGFGKGHDGRGMSTGTAIGSGEDAGPLAPFGTVGGGTPLGAMFVKDPAQRVVFVCDASGSMLDKFDILRRELARAVHRLHPVQSFDLIFFQHQSCRPLADNLLLATPDAMRSADRFLDTIIPREETNPIPALELAFKQKPDLIHLLTDGDFPDNQAVLDCIARHDPNHKVRINTIAFVGDRDTDKEFTVLLKRIANESGGTYRYQRERDF